MSNGSTNSGVGNESSLLSEMCLDEVTSILLTKTDYDMEFPDHKKDMSLEKMFRIARAAVVERLCDPDGEDESNFECDYNLYFNDQPS